MLPPNECEEAYIAGRTDGSDDERNGNPRVPREKYDGEPQYWYAQGYYDSYGMAAIA